MKVHFQRMTTNYSNWLVNKIVDKEAKMVAMRSSFSEIIETNTMKIAMNSKDQTLKTQTPRTKLHQPVRVFCSHPMKVNLDKRLIQSVSHL